MVLFKIECFREIDNTGLFHKNVYWKTDITLYKLLPLTMTNTGRITALLTITKTTVDALVCIIGFHFHLQADVVHDNPPVWEFSNYTHLPISFPPKNSIGSGVNH